MKKKFKKNWIEHSIKQMQNKDENEVNVNHCISVYNCNTNINTVIQSIRYVLVADYFIYQSQIQRLNLR